jgi:signal transduction histidine kinase
MPMKHQNGNSSPKYRPAVYLLGAVFAIAVIVFAESLIWRDVSQIRQRTATIISDQFHLSEQLETRIRALNLEVLRYPLQATPERRATIESESEALRLWLAQHRDSIVVAGERELLARAETVYAQYTAHAGLILQTNYGSMALPAWRERKEKILDEMLAVTAELNRAEKAEASVFLTQTRRSMDLLFRKLIFSSLILLAMGGALSFLAYRGLIAPLHSRLRQSEHVIERQEKLSSLGVLAAGVAHEIRNPLTSIKARLYTQQSLLAEKSEALEDNAFITEEVSRLEKIVADFLAFARPSEPQMVALKATQPFRDLEGMFRPALAKANIELKKEFLADPHIQADPRQLKQVLINLVQNAAESMGRDGTITLRTRTQKRHRATHPATFAVLEVEDTGKGVPPEVQKRLFDPFFTTKSSGTGLGLSIAARILEKHGGTLEYQPAQHRGAIFRLVLPIATTEHD